MIHELKILKSFADAIISGDKTFEVRHNDRGFQKGDKVRFKVEDNSEKREDHPISKKSYEITYGIFVHLGFNELSQDEHLVQALGNAIHQSFDVSYKFDKSETIKKAAVES